MDIYFRQLNFFKNANNTLHKNNIYVNKFEAVSGLPYLHKRLITPFCKWPPWSFYSFVFLTFYPIIGHNSGKICTLWQTSRNWNWEISFSYLCFEGSRQTYQILYWMSTKYCPFYMASCFMKIDKASKTYSGL